MAKGKSAEGVRKLKVVPYREVGSFLRQRRKALGFGTMKALYNVMLGFDPNIAEKDFEKKISAWETGVNRPGADVALTLLKALGIEKGTAEYDQWERLYGTVPQEQRHEIINRRDVTVHYLQWVSEQFRRLDLYGLHGADRRSDIELEQVFVALRGGVSNPYVSDGDGGPGAEGGSWAETARSGNTGSSTHFTSATTQRPIDIDERDTDQLFGVQRAKMLSLGEAFRQEARLVILGDPGSGKTTLLRWLALILAKAGMDSKLGERVAVAHHLVDPNVPENDEAPFDLGPIRIPIYVRVASFLDRRARLKLNISFEDHLGHHLAPYGDPAPRTADGRELNPDELNKLFKWAISERRAVLLLDGLDEIADELDRQPIAAEIDRFLNEVLFAGKTASDGGATDENQVVVTSRVVGYQLAGLGPNSTHMTLEPMGKLAVGRYCRLYTRERLRAMHGLQILPEDLRAKAEADAANIIGEIDTLRENGAADLASTPLLLTILIMVSLPDGRLPERRAVLYREAVDRILQTWEDRVKRLEIANFPSRQNIEKYLRHLAFELQTHSGLGLIDREGAIGRLDGLGPDEEIESFIACASEDIGLLTAKGAKAIGFQHQTFQEYYAAGWLLHDPAKTLERIRDRISSSRWREPILLALGSLSTTARRRPADRLLMEQILLRLADTPTPNANVLPAEFVVACNALRELLELPLDAIVALARRTIDARAAVRSASVPDVLNRQIRGALISLSEARCRSHLVEELRKALVDGAVQPSARAMAAGSLVPLIAAFDVSVVKAMVEALPNDSADWDWPIDRALRIAVARDAFTLPYQPNSLASVLSRSKELAGRLLSDVRGRKVCFVLYGGFDATVNEQIATLSLQKTSKKELLARVDALPRDAVTTPLVENYTAEIAAMDDRLKLLRAESGTMRPEWIHRDCPRITTALIGALREGLEIRSIEPMLRETLESSNGTVAELVDFATALVAISDDPLVEFERTVRGSALEMGVLDVFSRCGQYLQPIVAAAVRPGLGALCNVTRNREDLIAVEIMDAILAVSIRHRCPPVAPSDLISEASEVLRPHVVAELWRHCISDDSDDAIYNATVVLDTIGAHLSDPTLLFRSLAAIPTGHMGNQARQAAWANNRLRPVPRSDDHVIGLSLDLLADIPEQFGFVAGWMVSMLADRFIGAGMGDEARIIAQSYIGEQMGGRRMAVQALERDAPIREADTAWMRERLECRRKSATFTEGAPEPKRMESPIERGFQLEGEQIVLVGEYLRQLGPLDPNVSQEVVVQNSIVLAALEMALTIEMRLLQAVDNGNTVNLLIECMNEFVNSRDHENFFRFLLRLSDNAPVELERAILSAALDRITHIANPATQATALNLIEGFLEPYENLVGKRASQIEALDPWYRDVANGLTSRRLYVAAEAFEQCGVASLPLCLGAFLFDLETVTGRRLIATPNLPQFASAGTGVFSMAAGPSQQQLDHRFVSDLEKVLRENIAEMRRSIAMAVNPTLQAIREISTWERSYPELHDISVLLSAEVHGIGPAAIEPVLEMLNDPNDFIRCRAEMLLYGRDRSAANTIRISKKGAVFAEEIARLAVERRNSVSDDCRQKLALTWLNEYVLHDSKQAMNAWLEEAMSLAGQPTARRDIVLEVIRRINYASRSVQIELISALRSAYPELQCAILSCLTMLAGRSALSEDTWTLLTDEAEHVPVDVRSRFHFCASLSDFSHAIVKKTPVPLWSLFPDDQAPMTLRERFDRAGAMRLYGEFYGNQISKCTDGIPLTVESMTEVVRYVVAVLKQGDGTKFELWSEAGEALVIAAALIEKSAQTFFKAMAAPLGPSRETESSLRDQLEGALLHAMTVESTFTGRAAAITILSQLRVLSTRVGIALRRALRDVPFVQAAALSCASRFQIAEPGGVEVLRDGLYDRSASALSRAICAQLLTKLSHNSKVGPSVEPSIQQFLSGAVEVMETHAVLALRPPGPGGAGHSVAYIGQLDQIVLQTLVEPIETSMVEFGLAKLGIGK